MLAGTTLEEEDLRLAYRQVDRQAVATMWYQVND